VGFPENGVVDGMSEKKKGKAGIKELSPIDVYKLLPKTNCK
jgi:ArsR family metal-binding transcriptional regulator